MYFWTYGLRKTWLDKCLKSPFSDNPSTINMVNVPKHCWNLNDSTFTIFICHSACNWRWKSLSEWYVKSLDCLLTHWLPMTSILFLTEAIHCHISRCNYISIENIFPDSFLHFQNLDWILNIFNKKMTVIADLFLSIGTPKNVVR